jgi:hypothetical protein
MSYDSEILADSPLFYWKGEETSGTSATDSSSGGTFTGTYASVTLNQTGPGTGNRAIAYNGSTSNTQRSAGALSSITSSTPFTIEVWCKGTTGASNACLLGLSSNIATAQIVALMLGGTGNVFPVLRMRNDGASGVDAFSSTPSGTSVCDGSWHHVVGTFDGTSARTYVDGSLKSTVNGGAAGTSTITRTTAGALQRTTLSFPYTGNLSRKAMYGTALSLSRIQAHYNAMSASFPWLLLGEG